MALRARQLLGKYRILRRISSGAWADVYEAMDTIEGVRVALKVPHATRSLPQLLEEFRAEVRIAAQLDHPSILSIKNADFIDETFVITCPLGIENLTERLTKRLSTATALSYSAQMIEALAHAHERKVIHCDVKPDNLIVFPGDRLKLTDFGISRISQRTVSASGSGTVGYVAPEQALGKPRFQSDVFSAAIVIYQMFSGERPEWPFRSPLPGARRLRRNAPPEFIAFLKRCLEVDHRKRYKDARTMLRAFRAVEPVVEQFLERRRRRDLRARSSRLALNGRRPSKKSANGRRSVNGRAPSGRKKGRR